MIITKITVKNFKSLCSESESFEPFNTFVGQNNHGKTNFFDGINWFFNGFARSETLEDLRYCNATKDQEVLIEIEFSGLQEAIAQMSNAAKKTAMENLFGAEDNIVIRRSSSLDNGKKRELKRPDTNEWANIMGADSAWNDLLPTLEYVHTKVKLADVEGYKKSTPIGDMLSGVLSTIVETNPQYLAFKQQFSALFDSEESEIRVKLNEIGARVQLYLQKQFPDGTNVKFDVQNPVFDDLLKNISTEVNDGVLTRAEEKGDGMQRAIMLSIIQVYADYRRETDAAKKFIFLIDEAELHLHPSAQRALKNALVDISTAGEQVFVNSHSSVLVSDDSSNQGIYKVEKTGGETDIDRITESEKPYIIFELLGGSPADLLLPRNFIIVEEKSDFEFLKRIMKRFYPDEQKGIQIVFSGGDITEQEGSLTGVHKVFAPIATAANPLYKSKAVVLCDEPNRTNRNKYDLFRNGYPYLVEGEQLHILPFGSIEEYYPDPWKKTADEVREMSAAREKVNLAIEASENITLEQLQREMPVIYETIQKSFSLSFG